LKKEKKKKEPKKKRENKQKRKEKMKKNEKKNKDLVPILRMLVFKRNETLHLQVFINFDVCWFLKLLVPV